MSRQVSLLVVRTMAAMVVVVKFEKGGLSPWNVDPALFSVARGNMPHQTLTPVLSTGVV